MKKPILSTHKKNDSIYIPSKYIKHSGAPTYILRRGDLGYYMKIVKGCSSLRHLIYRWELRSLPDKRALIFLNSMSRFLL